MKKALIHSPNKIIRTMALAILAVLSMTFTSYTIR